MTDIIMNILQWAIPSGGIGAAIAWIANRKVKTAEQEKKVHDIYKAMYEDLGARTEELQKKINESAKENARAIEDLNKENARTRYALNRLSRAIEAIQLCPHRSSCPVNSELQNGADDGEEPAPRAKHRQQRKPKQPSVGSEEQPEPDDMVVDTAGERRHGEPADTAG